MRLQGGDFEDWDESLAEDLRLRGDDRRVESGLGFEGLMTEG